MSAIGPGGGARRSDSRETEDATYAQATPEAPVVRNAGTGAPKKTDPLAMPAEIVAYEKKQMWGMMHLEWHMERRWASFTADPQNAAYAKKMGWKPAARQEGDAGNGMDFLAMHRAMIGILTKKFPQDAALFQGWKTPPLDPKDPQNPVPSGQPIDPKMAKAIDTLDHIEQHLADFPTDDDLGRFIETSMGKAFPQALGAAGVHNYLHNRFSDPNSKIDIGDPTVNLQNQMFWRLHGWIDTVWTRYRAAKGEKATDPAYAKAMKDAAKGMGGMPMKGALGSAGDPAADAVPGHVRKWLETHPG